LLTFKKIDIFFFIWTTIGTIWQPGPAKDGDFDCHRAFLQRNKVKLT